MPWNRGTFLCSYQESWFYLLICFQIAPPFFSKGTYFLETSMFFLKLAWTSLWPKSLELHMEKQPDKKETDLIFLPSTSISQDHRSRENCFPHIPLKEKINCFLWNCQLIYKLLFHTRREDAAKCPSAPCHPVLDSKCHSSEPKGYQPAGAASTRGRIFQAQKLFDNLMVQPLKPKCYGVHWGHLPTPVTHMVWKEFQGGFASSAIGKPRSVFIVLFAKYLVQQLFLQLWTSRALS